MSELNKNFDSKVDVVIPTFNRLWGLRKVVSFYLGLREVRSVIVVDDCSTDGTDKWLRQEAEKNVRLCFLRHESNRGASAARNTGARATLAPFVFFADDDMILFPLDGLSFMAQELFVNSADIAAPIHIISEATLPVNLPPIISATSENQPPIYNKNTLELLPRKQITTLSFPGSIATPLACGLMLMKQSVLQRVSYDEGLGATSYRDETDFQLKALREGFHLVACSRPILIDLVRSQDDGGCHTLSQTAYELMACSNNWRIMRRHSDVIHQKLGIDTPIFILQFRFFLEHAINRLARFYLGKFLRRCGLMRKVNSFETS